MHLLCKSGSLLTSLVNFSWFIFDNARHNYSLQIEIRREKSETLDLEREIEFSEKNEDTNYFQNFDGFGGFNIQRVEQQTGEAFYILTKNI